MDGIPVDAGNATQRRKPMSIERAIVIAILVIVLLVVVSAVLGNVSL